MVANEECMRLRSRVAAVYRGTTCTFDVDVYPKYGLCSWQLDSGQV